MKLPNGYGTVYKLSGKRRKPWIARKTKNWILEDNKVKQEYMTIGYYSTRTEALNALASYNQNPYDIDKNNITFSEVYEKWADRHFEGLTDSTRVLWESVYKHCMPLYDMKFRDIRVSHMEGVIDDANVGAPTKKKMKMLFNQLYKYALKNEIVDKNYAELVDNVKYDSEKLVRLPFTDDEIEMLWDNTDLPFVDALLIEIYSGWRPREVLSLKTADIDFENDTMTGGSKTAAGKNRCVPIHPKIRPIIEKHYNPDFEYLYSDGNNKPYTYSKYRYALQKLNKELGMNHYLHDTRHTFVTLGKRYGMDEYILKLIIGHTVSDITEKVYTHRDIEQLRAEILKIP